MNAKLILASFVWMSPLTSAEFDPSRPHHMETTSKGRVVATLKVDLKAPTVHAKEWIIVAPLPPEMASQKLDDFQFFVGETTTNGERGTELSDLGRPIWTSRVEAAEPNLASSIDFRLQYDLTLRKCRLVEGPPTEAPPPLESREKDHFLRSTPTTDWKSEPVQKWLSLRRLTRKTGESDLAFAYRAFHAVAAKTKYESPTGDRRPSAVCQSGRSDCGGLSLLLVAALRANGIPARTLWGRWAKSQEGDYGQWHVKAEFFADGVGWVPVEVAGAVALPNIEVDNLFGWEEGNFITLHYDTDLLVETFQFGKQPIGWRQGVLYWVFGPGTLDDFHEVEHWDVRKVAPAKDQRP